MIYLPLIFNFYHVAFYHHFEDISLQISIAKRLPHYHNFTKSLEIPILISSSCVALKSYIIFALWFIHLIKQTKPISENMKENMNLNSRRIKS